MRSRRIAVKTRSWTNARSGPSGSNEGAKSFVRSHLASANAAARLEPPATNAPPRYMLETTALMRRTPAELDCSLRILKPPSSFVFATCGPQQISFETSPIV